MSVAVVHSMPARRAAPERPAKRREGRGAAYLLAFAGALLLHGVIFYVLRTGLIEGPEFSVSVGDSSVEVTLVAAPSAPEPLAEQVAPEPVEPPPPPVEPPPTPPEPPPPEAMVEPTPPPPPVAPAKPSPPKPAAPKKPTPRPPVEAPAAVGDGSSATPGLDATTSRASSGDRAQPGYLRNPHPAYPEEARRARQEGAVTLRVRVQADGNVASVSLTRGSGFPLLDERALSTVRDRWSFKPARMAGLNIPSEVIIPIRFSLRD